MRPDLVQLESRLTPAVVPVGSVQHPEWPDTVARPFAFYGDLSGVPQSAMDLLMEQASQVPAGHWAVMKLPIEVGVGSIDQTPEFATFSPTAQTAFRDVAGLTIGRQVLLPLGGGVTRVFTGTGQTVNRVVHESDHVLDNVSGSPSQSVAFDLLARDAESQGLETRPYYVGSRTEEFAEWLAERIVDGHAPTPQLDAFFAPYVG